MPLIRPREPARDEGRPAPDAPADDVAALRARTAAARRAAVQRLEGQPGGIDALCRHLPDETAASVREAILAVLLRHRSVEVVTALLPLLRSEDAALRNAAIEGLAEMPDEVAPHIDTLLADPDNDVRIFAANLLSLLPHRRAGEWLRVALADPHPNVCAAAIDGLAEIGDAAAAAALAAVPARFPGNALLAFAADIAARRIRAC